MGKIGRQLHPGSPGCLSAHIGTHFVSFKIETHKEEFISTVKNAIKNGDIIRTQITPNNLKQVFDKWVLMIGHEIKGIAEEDYALMFFADIMKDGTVSRHDNLPVVAETGADMKAFENSGKLSGWTGLRPRNDESAGKYKSTVTTNGNKFLRTIMVQVAWAASCTKGAYFKEKFNRLAMRKSRKKALIAIARKMGVLIWNVLHYEQQYNPQKLIVYDPGKVQAKMSYHQKEWDRLQGLLK